MAESLPTEIRPGMQHLPVHAARLLVVALPGTGIVSGVACALREKEASFLPLLVALLAATLARSLGRGFRLHGVHWSTLDTFITDR